MSSETSLTADEIDIIKHSLGVDRNKKPYRNYYCASVGDPKLEALVTKGVMRPGRIINTDSDHPLQYYIVTEAGAKFVGTTLPKDD